MTIQHKDSAEIRRIAFLDYLRIFAFSSVCIGHLFYSNITAFTNNPLAHSIPKVIVKLLLPLFMGGGIVGMVTFFLISGYIIVHVLQTEQAVDFLIRRIFRIYPLYMIAVLLQYVMSGSFPKLSALIPQLLLIGDFFNTPLTLGGVEWTLRAEVVFYAFMATLRYLDLTSTTRAFKLWDVPGAPFRCLSEDESNQKIHKNTGLFCHIIHLNAAATQSMLFAIYTIAHKNILSLLFIGTTLLCGFLAPFPTVANFNFGYFTIYWPFLLLGSMF